MISFRISMYHATFMTRFYQNCLIFIGNSSLTEHPRFYLPILHMEHMTSKVGGHTSEETEQEICHRKSYRQA